MPRIYVASVSDYNNGHLHGVWIDLGGLDIEDVQEKIALMLLESKYPNTNVECPCIYSGRPGLHEDTGLACKICDGDLLAGSAEEWAVHDYEDLPSSFGEHPALSELIEYVEKVEEYGDAWVAYMEDQGCNSPDEDDFNDRYAGSAVSESDWIYGFVEDSGLLGDAPTTLTNYFDYDAYLRDMKLGGEISFVHLDGTVYAFRV